MSSLMLLIISASCPEVVVRMMPGKSTKVRSGESGEVSCTLIVSVEKPLPLAVSVSVRRNMIAVSSCGVLATIVCGEVVMDAIADHFLS